MLTFGSEAQDATHEAASGAIRIHPRFFFIVSS